jgi:hypothetical protein
LHHSQKHYEYSDEAKLLITIFMQQYISHYNLSGAKSLAYATFTHGKFSSIAADFAVFSNHNVANLR